MQKDLGDNIYAEWDNKCIILTVATITIYLEEKVIKNLVNFINKDAQNE